MARILCLTSGATGVYRSFVELARRLGADGHEVTLGSLTGQQTRFAPEGLSHLELPNLELDPSTTRRVTRKQAEQLSDQVVAIVSEVGPDLVICDLELHEYFMALRVRGQPVVLLNHFFDLERHPGLPSLASRVIPGRGIAGSRGMIELSMLGRGLKLRARDLVGVLAADVAGRRRLVRQYASHIGFPHKNIQLNTWLWPLTYRNLDVLCVTSKELDFEHDPNPGFKYVGPMLAPIEQATGAGTTGSNSRLSSILERLPSGVSVAYLQVSTMFETDMAFIRKVIEGFGSQPEWCLIVGLGGRVDVAEQMDVPDNVHLFDWAPQLEVLAAADVAVIRSGIHTIHECIQAEVPMLVYSKRISDQNGNAARVQSKGLGHIGDPENDGPEDIRRSAEKLISSSETRQSLAEVSRAQERYRTDRTLQRVVAELLDRAEPI